MEGSVAVEVECSMPLIPLARANLKSDPALAIRHFVYFTIFRGITPIGLSIDGKEGAYKKGCLDYESRPGISLIQ